MRRFVLGVCLGLMSLISTQAKAMVEPYRVFQDTVTVQDDDLLENQDYVWTPEHLYVLDGLVYVDSLSTLTIAPGTVVQAMPGTGVNASALIVTRGAKIIADGTPVQPIIFTAYNDTIGKVDDIPYDQKGLWGGLILLGRAVTSYPAPEYIEGLPKTDRSLFGGDDDDDNSGVLRYVSVRYGGTNLGSETGNEINGISFGAIGSQTIVDFVEVYSNFDDGVEFWGGTVKPKHMVMALNGDDGFDYDAGFRGRGQFWFVIQGSDAGNHAGEHDGGDGTDDAEPYSLPIIYNATYIGSGAESENVDNTTAILQRDNAGGKYFNSVFTDFYGSGLEIEDLADGAAEDSRKRFEAGDIEYAGNYWYGFGDGNTADAIFPQQFIRDNTGFMTANHIESPMLNGISRVQDGGLDPRPMPGSPVWNIANLQAYPDDEFFTPVDYAGAFGENLWIKGWTFTDEVGLLHPEGERAPTKVITDASIGENEVHYWSNDTTYVLDGFVYVDSLSELHIEAGTVVKAMTGSGVNASALIVTRGAKIFAEGTAEDPIIFTSYDDDVNVTWDKPLRSPGEWGGLVLLGRAVTSYPAPEYIEGLPKTDRSLFGGNDDNDNSGVLRYVSVRYGGTNLGSESGNEINGISFGAIGSQTVIENVEVFSNFDDGVEFWGGTVKPKFMVMALNGDDGFDYDAGFRGRGQFWFVIQAADAGNHAGEHDGGDGTDDAEPYSLPIIYNATYIGSGALSDNVDNTIAILQRDNAGGKYFNSVFTDFYGYGLEIEDLADGAAEDSRKRFEAGDIEYAGNYWYGFGDGNTAEAIFPQQFIRDNTDFMASNYIESPQLRSIGRTPEETLDPRPGENSPLWNDSRLKAYPEDDFYTPVAFAGAFGTKNWAAWTFLAQSGVLTSEAPGQPDKVTAIESQTSAAPTAFTLSQNAPNPFNPTTTISFAIPSSENVRLSIYNVVGQHVATLVDGYRVAGTYSVTFNAEGLGSGLYIYRLQAGGQTMTKRMMFIR